MSLSTPLLLSGSSSEAPSMAASLPIVSLLLFCLLSLSSSLPSHAVLYASEILIDSGHVSMALTLELVSQTQTQNLKTSSLTIFAPPDSAFSKSGQPALSLLQYHFCPLPLSRQTLKALPAGTKIPTLLSGHVLIVTSSPFDSQVSLNNVKITSGSPIFNDGSLIIFGVEDFFDPNSQVPGSVPAQKFDSTCESLPIGFPGASWFKEASANLRFNGYSAMASILDLQLLGFDKDRSATMTVFAPTDQAMSNSPSKDSLPSIFLRHVVPCRLLWSDLVGLNDGTVLPTYSDGFTITITRSENVLMLNGIPVFYANMHYSDLITVHGLNEVLVPQGIAESIESESSAGTDGLKIEDIMQMENIKF